MAKSGTKPKQTKPISISILGTTELVHYSVIIRLVNDIYT